MADGNRINRRDEALDEAAARLCEAIRAEPVPPAIRDLALRLQALIDARAANAPKANAPEN